MSDRVTRSSLRRLTPIQEPRVLPVVPDCVWSDEEWSRIQRGYRARSMDERWHVFAEGDLLFLHRSWLGDGKYEVTFEAVEGGRRINEIRVESGPRSFPGGPDEAKCVLLEVLIRSILLGDPVKDLRERLQALRRRGDVRPGPVDAW